MKLYKVGRYLILAAAGLIIFTAGLVLMISSRDAVGILKTLPYICVGLGSGIFGGSIGTALKNRTMLKDPQAAKYVEIEQKDERNQAVNNRSKARVYDLMIYVYAAVILSFALMQVNMYVTLVLVVIYLFFIFANVYYLNKYNKEM